MYNVTRLLLPLGSVGLKVKQSNLKRYPMMCDELDKGCKAQKPERKVEVVGELSKVFSIDFPVC